MRGLYEKHYNALSTYQKSYSLFSETYNLGWWNHSNLSWKSKSQPNKAHTIPPYQPTSSRNSLEDALHVFIEAQRERGKFYAHAQLNLRGQHVAQTSGLWETNLKEVNTITTRSGKVIEPTHKPREDEKDHSNSKESTPKKEAVKNPSRMHLPQALKSISKSVGQHSEILEHLKQVKINLPLLHVISQVFTYAKILKDLCTVKRKYHLKKTAFLTDHVSAMIEQKIPPKYKDPSCPTVSCVIGNHVISQALLDLGASVNIMLYDIYLSFGLGEIKAISVSL
ncbi:uncharacterized protein LOC111373604 [Olea europaea var. sylvestris]|uniref:uncharacterized protein LOC111373604 n=1 Tax=Olea europaea var. sylvestris TaxID=158386 RepID=UPI000C1CE7CF|nr:uncharacterized protein LOC111373604 [Olea europaea var. sylvestris]